MIYLILDTNTWIYLANGKDPITDNSNEEYHFLLFEKLKQKVDDGTVKILINEIIEQEWKRNKNNTFELIKLLKNRLKSQIKNLKSIGKELQHCCDEEITKIQSAYEKLIDKKIKDNEQHIESVEKLLKSSVKVSITKDVKVIVADWSVEGNAPFKGDKKNSMADALILFSSIDFIKQELYDDFLNKHDPIFVSGNKGDFSDEKEADLIHSDLAPKLKEVEMLFFRSLPKALNTLEEKLFQEEEVRRIEEEMQLFYEANLGYCNVCSPDEEHESLNIIHFNGGEEIDSEIESNPNQMDLDFDEDGMYILKDDTPETYYIERGDCMLCGTEHIRCGKCKESTPIDDATKDGFECEGCGTFYKITHKYLGSGMFEDRITMSKNPNEK
jgi:hypothetical protein